VRKYHLIFASSSSLPIVAVPQAERLARRRNDEVAAVRRAAVESLRKERAQWVAVSAFK